MRTFALVAAGVTFGLMTISSAALAGPGQANAAAGRSTAPGQNKLQCFDGTTDGGYGGVCTLNNNGAKGSATLNNTDSNPAGDYAGVYIGETTLAGQLLTKVTQLGYSYSSASVPHPGNLSLNLPIDTNGDGATDGYAFIDAAYCPGTAGRVDVVNDASCGIYYQGTTYYGKWAQFVMAYPGAKVATDALPFVIAERTPSEAGASWVVSNVKLGKAGK
jgi:hypothetical protein